MLGGVSNLVGDTLSGGNWLVSDGANLDFNGASITTNSANISLSGSTSVFSAINSLTDNRGTFSLANGRSFTTAGAFSNTGGLISVGSQGVFNVNGALTLAGGTISLAPGSQIDVARLVLNGDVSVNPSASGSVINNSAAVTDLAGFIDLNGATRTFTVGDGSAAVDLCMAAPIADGAVTKAGAGLMRLESAGTYSGATTISAGTLQTGIVNAIASSSDVRIASAGTLDLGGFDQSINALNDSAGTSGAVNLDGATLSIQTGGGSFSGSVSGTGAIVRSGGGAGSQTFAGVLSHTGGVSVDSGQLYLAGPSNTFTGQISVTGGASTLSIASDQSLGNASNAITLSNGGVLQATQTLSSARAINIGASSSGLVDVVSGATMTLAGNISGNSGTFGKSGGGALAITSTNTFAGNVNVAGGTLEIATGAGGAMNGVHTFVIGVDGSLKFNQKTNGFAPAISPPDVVGGDVTLDGGHFIFAGDDSTLSYGTFGTLTPRSSASSVQLIEGNSGSTELHFSALGARGTGATLDYSANSPGVTNKLFFGSGTNTIGSWFTVTDTMTSQTNFATYSASQGVIGYGSDIYNDSEGNINIFASGKDVLLEHNAPAPNPTDPPATVGSVSIKTLKIDTVGTQTIDVQQLNNTTLTLSDGGLIKTGANAASIGPTGMNIGVLDSGSGELNVFVSGGTFTINSTLAGSFTLTKRGDGTLNLAGQSANSYTGATVVSGVMELNKMGGDAIPGTLLISGGTVISRLSNQIADTGSVTLDSGTFDLNGKSETIAALTNNGGTLLLHGGTLSVTGATVFNGGQTVVASQLTTGNSLVIAGGDNQIGNDGVVTVGTGGMTFTTGTSGIGFTSTLSAGKIVLNGDVTATNTDGTAVISVTPGAISSVDLHGGIRKFNVGSGSSLTDLRIEAPITGDASSRLFKTGAGTLKLTAANSYAGGTVIDAGVLEVTDGGLGAGTSSVQFNNDAALNLRSNSPTAVFGNPILTSSSGSMSIDVGRNSGSGGNIFQLGAASFGASFDLSGSGTLQLSGGVLQASSADLFIRTGANATTLIDGAISDTGAGIQGVQVFDPAGGPGLGKASVVSVGTVIFRSITSQPNVYSGNTTVNNGTLVLDHVNSGSISGNYSIPNNLIINGGTVVFAQDNQIAPGGTILFGAPPLPHNTPASTAGSNSNSVLNLNGHSQTLSALTMTGGGVSIGAGVLTLQSTLPLIVSGSSAGATIDATSLGKLSLPANSTIFVDDGAAAYDLTISAPLFANGFVKTGAGDLFLSADNTAGLSGLVKLNGGVLTAQNASSLGNATIQFNGGALDLLDGSAGNSPIDLGNGGTINVPTGKTVTYASNISGGGTIGLTKTGGGTLLLRGAGNTFTGTINLAGGTVNVDQDARLGNNANVLSMNGGVLQAASAVASLSTSRNVYLNAINAGGFDVDATQTLSLNGSGTLGGAGDLVKSGAGTMIVNRSYNYSGATTVNAGTLRFDVPVNKLNAATLSGNWFVGSSGTLTFNANGNVTAIASDGAVTLSGSGSNFPAINWMTANAGNFSVKAGRNFHAPGSASFNNSGTITVGAVSGNDGSVLRFPANFSNNGPSAVLDVNGVAIVDYPTGSSPLSAMQQQIRRAYQAGYSTNGAGQPIITSSAAGSAAMHVYGLGAINASDIIPNGSTTVSFANETVDAKSTLLRFTYLGDTDLNGKVDGSDYAHIDLAFGHEANAGNIDGWYNGDFDYNGKVDGGDYALIDIGFNQQNGTLDAGVAWLLQEEGRADNSPPIDPAEMDSPGLQMIQQHFAQFGEPYARVFLSTVPEPASALASLVGLASLGLVRRQRRRVDALDYRAALAS